MSGKKFIREFLDSINNGKSGRSSHVNGCKGCGKMRQAYFSVDNYLNAIGASAPAGNAPVSASRPYVITVQNTSGNTVPNVVIFNANGMIAGVGVTAFFGGNINPYIGAVTGTPYLYTQSGPISNPCTTAPSALNSYFPTNALAYYGTPATNPPSAEFAPIVLPSPNPYYIFPASSLIDASTPAGLALYHSLCTGGSIMNAAGVIISSGLPNVSYQFLLAQSQTNPFKVGKTLLQLTGGNGAQLTQPMNLITTDGSGLQETTPMVPVIDPYQFQRGTLVFEDKYAIDGMTALQISNVLPNASFNILTFPDSSVSHSLNLFGDHSLDDKHEPTLVRNNLVIVPNNDNGEVTLQIK